MASADGRDTWPQLMASGWEGHMASADGERHMASADERDTWPQLMGGTHDLS